MIGRALLNRCPDLWGIQGAGEYLDLVKYVEDKYYIRVSRYTTSGFMRLKLAHELDKRHVTSEVYETRKQASDHLSPKP